jgi:lipid A 3-O-deacylase
MTMRHLSILIAFATALPSRGDEAPFDDWSFDVDTGSLWRFGVNTDLDYVVVPTTWSLRTPAHIKLQLGEGDLVVRTRASLLTEWVARGPEDYYLGFSASPSIEYWLPGRRTEFHFSIGGGIGIVNHQANVDGAQGRDKTYNWFMLAGVRHLLNDHWAVHGGVMFQHFSNLGATDPNPGLDGLGPIVGLSYRF